MRILWFSWKDISHPQAGGAEVVAHELIQRLVKDGHAVTLLTAQYPHAIPKETRDGYTIIRVGNRFTVYWHAYRYYKTQLQQQFDLVIEEINTVPFFTAWYVREKQFLFMHQLARQIWFYQMPFPVSVIGYVLEPLYLWLLRACTVITISQSTKTDLVRLGFSEKNIHIISEGIQMEPVHDLAAIHTYEMPTLLSLGTVRPMKRTLDIVKAFEIAKERIPTLRLIIAGDTSGTYGDTVKKYIEHSQYAPDISMLGKVSPEQRRELMQRAHALAVTSVREGWGLVVTEANSQGTPAVVYDVHGLRDSVKDGTTGLVAKANTPHALADALVDLLHDTARYETMRHSAWHWSREITFEKSYTDLVNILFPVNIFSS